MFKNALHIVNVGGLTLMAFIMKDEDLEIVTAVVREEAVGVQKCSSHFKKSIVFYGAVHSPLHIYYYIICFIRV